MFYGRYPHRLNAKYQVTLPSRLRAVLERQTEDQALHILRIDPRCLYIYTSRGLDQIVEALKQSGGAGAKHPDFRRLFFSSVTPVDLDPHGRFVIPAELRQAAGIERDVIFVGNAERMELWAAGQWEKLQASEQESYQQRLQQNVVDLLEW